jgi:hypothetical protein
MLTSIEQLQPATSSTSPLSAGHCMPLLNGSSMPTVSPFIDACDGRGFGPVIHVFDGFTSCCCASCCPASREPNPAANVAKPSAMPAARVVVAMSKMCDASPLSPFASSSSSCCFVVALMLPA